MKYFILLLFALSFPLKASSQLAMPIGGEQNKDWWIYSYYDDDTTAGSARNFKCSNYCYNGWTGMIFAIKNMKLMDKGIPILAAGNGVVISVHNGDTDRVKQSIGGGTHGNFIRIQHNPQLFTVYAFLRDNSIKVHDGQIVKKGDTIAMAGSSDNICYWPGLYFRVEDTVNANSKDPLGDECSSPPQPALLSPGPVYDTSFGIIDFGVTNHANITNDTLIERPPTITEVSSTEDDYACVWLQYKNVYIGDSLGSLWTDPHGNIYSDRRNSAESSNNHFGYNRNRIPVYKLDTGNWNVTYYYNYDSICHLTFHVVEQHSGVAQSNANIQTITFPQPSKDHVTINGLSAKEAHIYNVDGIEHPIRFENNTDGVTIFWQDLPKGVYYFSIKDEKGILHRAKIMVSP